MKNIFIGLFVLGMFLFSLPVEAGLDIKNIENKTDFETNINDISKVTKTNFVKFDIGVENIVNPQNISYWKVRSYCDKSMYIKVASSTSSSCGKSVKINSLEENSFSFLFDNKDNFTKNFSIKLKAYDKNGKWLHTEKENFRWK